MRGMDKPKILVTLGSPSDAKPERELLSQLEQIIDRCIVNDDLIDLNVAIASADRVPELVRETVEHAVGGYWDAIVACAGLANVLASAYKNLVCPTRKDGIDYILSESPHVHTLVYAVPLSDKNTGGVASFLSTVEKAPGYPIPTVGVDQLGNALNLALSSLRRERVTLVNTGNPEKEGYLSEIKRELESFDVPYGIAGYHTLAESPPKASIMIYPGVDEGLLEIDRQQACVLASCHKPYDEKTLAEWFEITKQTKHTAYTATMNPRNIAQIAAEIIGIKNNDVSHRVLESLHKGRTKYDPFLNLISIPITKEKMLEPVYERLKEAV